MIVEALWKSGKIMSEVKDIMKKEVEAHRGEICIDILDIVELIDFAEDDDDNYYVVSTLKNGIYWMSGVGCPIWLKGQLSECDYNRLKYWWDLNKR